MHILLVEPNYYTNYPPLGLLKLASFYKQNGDTVELIKGVGIPRQKPDRICVTSLFTWAWREVHISVRYFKALFPKTEVWLGGLYASLMPEHAKLSQADRIVGGLFEQAEDLLPDYSLVPNWDASIIFASRGCPKNCEYCAVPKLEGKMNGERRSIRGLIYPGHRRIIFWDNNFFANRFWEDILDELNELQLEVDFNQGLDASFITPKVADALTKLKFRYIRLGYDTLSRRKSVRQAVELLKQAGIDGRNILVYTLFNFKDTPEDFLDRVRDVLNWGAVCYPMRFEPLDSLEKNNFISPNWTIQEVEMVQQARRVMGYGGAFPPYRGLVLKFNRAKNFVEAFALRPLTKRV